jgi:hypothetical protein
VYPVAEKLLISFTPFHYFFLLLIKIFTEIMSAVVRKA